MNEPTREEMKEYLKSERKIARTVAEKMPGNLYSRFRKKCIDKGIMYQQGIAAAIELWLKS